MMEATTFLVLVGLELAAQPVSRLQISPARLSNWICLVQGTSSAVLSSGGHQQDARKDKACVGHGADRLYI